MMTRPLSLLPMVALLAASAAWAQPMRRPMPTPTPSGSTVQAIGTLSSDTGAVGDLGSPGSKKWVTLICPQGQLVAGAQINQGGWLAQFQTVCATPSRSGGWSGDPVAGSSAGGQNGSHDAQLMCPRDLWVSGISGQITIVYYGVTRDKFVYLANPILYCSAPNQPSPQTVSDPVFQQEQHKNMNSAKYADSPAQYCGAGSFAQAVVVAIGGKNHPDVRAAKLRCVRFNGT